MKLKTENLLKAVAVLEALIILFLIIFIAWFCFIRDASAVKASTDPQVRVRPFIEKEETFYQLDGKKILTHNATMGETFIPIYADVPASTVDVSKLTADSKGFMKYSGEGKTFIGVDISEHQGYIDWEQVKASGVDFAMIRVGYRTYGDGNITIDTMLQDNLSGALAAGLDVGVYFFSQAIDEREAIEEADAVLNEIGGYNITYPVVFDWELIYNDHARTDDMTVEMLADCCVSFCERVKSAGYEPMIYQNYSTAMNKLDLPRLKDYGFWLAEYGSQPSYYYKYDIWQYSNSGEIDGIDTAVDMNICFRDYSVKTPENPQDSED